MDSQLSPNYSHEKLENPSFSDLVDVFEDMWRNCIFAPVELLLKSPNGDIAAMTILSSYFEALAGYISGKSTNGRSAHYFSQGFCVAFRSDSSEIHKAAQAIYKNIRCGLAHEGMLSHKVSFSRTGAKPFFLTYRKATDGSLDIDAGIVSIIVNPARMHEGVLLHFNKYVKALRDGGDKDLTDAFQNTVNRQWALGTSDNIIGMTEAEFLGRA